ncbi:hypothetical protein IFT48_05300 [Pseudomonas fluorescens]|uniref:hypothetical protein n=1 Tax=Pseudomonas fluorescens TaxID=294 RepID=UPI001930B3E9|nr:hypothetical protein [Pseudomonas fluorescens]MBD8089393.1 hypothetical protein [Pseudomonas fluorescens]
MSANDVKTASLTEQTHEDLVDGQAIVREYDPVFKALDRACDMLEKSLDSLTQSPSPLVH